MRVFCDTSAVLAWVNAADRRHEESVAAFEGLRGANASLITSSYVLSELYALVQRRQGLPSVARIVQDLEPLFETTWIGRDEHERGIHLMLSRSINGLSLVDATSIIVMRDGDIGVAWAYDKHFMKAGIQSWR